MTNSILDDFKNAWNKPNNAAAQLIIINVIVFLFLAVLSVLSTLLNVGPVFDIIHQQFSIPPIFSDFILRPWTIITYAFSHSLSRIFHIVFNMLFLYWFSRIIVEYLGNDKVISIYVVGALAGAVAYLFVYNVVPFYIESAPSIGGMVGASGAVNAIMIAAATLVPNYTFFLLFLGPVKIKYIAAFFIVISFLGSVGYNAGGNVAHLGGALMGYVYIKQLQKGTDWGAWVIRFLRFVKSLFVRQPSIKVSHRKQRASAAPKGKGASGRRGASTSGKASQDEIDAILDKISQSGYESLSKEEKQKLFDASNK